jgi:hypothetical protein
MAKAYYAEHKEEDNARSKRWRDNNREHHNAKSRQYYSEHKDEISEKGKQYRRDHKEEVSEKSKLRYQRNRERVRATQRRYYQKNKEAIYKHQRVYNQQHLEQARGYSRKYYRTEKGRLVSCASYQRYIARKKGAKGNLSKEQLLRKLKAQKFRCYYAAWGHAKFERRNGRYIYHIEHTVPISRTDEQPRHDMDFIVLACPTCNLSKGAKLPHEWPQGGRLF